MTLLNFIQKKMPKKGYKQIKKHKRKIGISCLGKGRPKGIPSNRKGKTLKEIYGEEKATILILKNKNSHIGQKRMFKTIEKQRQSLIIAHQNKNFGFKKGKLTGEKNYAKLPSVRKKISNFMIQNNPMFNPIHRKKRASVVSKIKGHFYYKNKHYRSSWEVEFVKKLETLNIIFKYEPKHFKLSNNEFYIPDFYLTDFNLWIEIKGYMDDMSKRKIKLFSKTYNILILDNLEKIKNITMEEIKCKAKNPLFF